MVSEFDGAPVEFDIKIRTQRTMGLGGYEVLHQT